MSELKSLKPYARLISLVSGIIIVIAGLDASQVIQLFPEYASQINTILIIAGIIAPVIAQEKRVTRAEELILDDVDTEEITVPINVNMNTDEVVSELKDYIDETYSEDSSDDSGGIIEEYDDGGA